MTGQRYWSVKMHRRATRWPGGRVQPGLVRTDCGLDVEEKRTTTDPELVTCKVCPRKKKS